jgi:hypothetical protein
MRSTRVSASRHIPDSEVKLLARSAGLCAFPACRQACTVPGTAVNAAKPVGEMAHIVAHSNNGPRADPALKDAERNLYGNLVLLCPTHHTIVDKQEHNYTVADLRGWKLDHEGWAASRLAPTLVSVGFRELEEVCQHLLAATSSTGSDLRLVAPGEKAARNSLSASTSMHITMGLTRVTEVQAFLEMKEKVDSGYADRLATEFMTKYHEHRNKQLSPDANFQALWEFACPGGAPHVAAAGLIVLTYLFERCEVFEKK